MIKNLIFDFGDVFINLDKEQAFSRASNLFELKVMPEAIHHINALYEQGLVSTEEFMAFYMDYFPNLNRDALLDLWNCILLGFPAHRLDFLRQLVAEKKYKLILLSNTNTLHINWIKENISFYEDFKMCFDAFYLSHEINLRKPNADIFEFVLNENSIKAEESLFIDDTEENIVTATALGLHTWHLDPKTEDVTSLFEVKSNLF